jgi:hypothetical protein
LVYKVSGESGNRSGACVLSYSTLQVGNFLISYPQTGESMLATGENSRVIESQSTGIFADIFASHGGEPVPAVLQACELLSPGEKIVADRAGQIVLAGTVRSRPDDFLAPQVHITRLTTLVETAEIYLPLHYFYFYEDGYGHRITGGGSERRWQKLGTLGLASSSVNSADIDALTLSLGPEQILRRQSEIRNQLTKKVMGQLLELPKDNHRAIDGLNIIKA